MFLRDIVAGRAETESIVPHTLKRYFTCLSLLSALATYALPSAALALPTGTTPTAEHPTVVSIGLVIRNLVAIDEVKENWQATGLLIARWSDPRLKYHPQGRGEFHRDVPGASW